MWLKFDYDSNKNLKDSMLLEHVKMCYKQTADKNKAQTSVKCDLKAVDVMPVLMQLLYEQYNALWHIIWSSMLNILLLLNQVT